MTTRKPLAAVAGDAALVAALIAVFVILLTRGQVLHWIGLI
jgi:hypothetical protein